MKKFRKLLALTFCFALLMTCTTVVPEGNEGIMVHEHLDETFLKY